VVRLAATPGEFEPANFAVFPLRELKNVYAELTDFEANNGRFLPASIADFRVVRCWPQRTDWRAKTFHVIPELLEQRETVDLAPGSTRQFYVIVRVPENAAPGYYQ